MSTIAIVSHIWQGHIPAYHRLLVERLQLTGHQVLSLAPVPEAELELAPAPDRMTHAFYGQSAPAQLLETQKARVKPGWRRFLDRTGGTALVKQTALPEIIRAVRHWRLTDGALASFEKATGRQVDFTVLVFPAAGYLTPALPLFLLDGLFPRSWAGIWNCPEMLANPTGVRCRTGRAFHARHCRGAIVPDTGMRDCLNKIDPTLRVFAMPEIADLRPAQSDLPQVTQLRQDAAGRSIIGLLGNVTLRKGIMTFLQIAAMAEARQLPLFFVAAGDFSLNSCGEEFATIEAACQSAPENFRLFPQRLADGPEFNAHVAACDIIFAAYHDFPFQSNLLTKAAAFAKPVIVSQGHVMEKRTVEFGLGLAVPQKNAAAALEAVCALLAETSRPSPRCTDYLRANSVNGLDLVLAELLAFSE